MSKRGLQKLSPAEINAIRRETRRLVLEIRSQREKLGFTQESLAEKLDVSVETIKGIETGRQFASLPVLIRICRVLRLQICLQIKSL